MVDLLNSLVLIAQDPIGTIHPPDPVPTDLSDLERVIATVITAAWSIAGVAAVGFIIAGGYFILTSAGDPNKMKKGQETLAYAIMGLVLVVCAGLIFNFVTNLLGIGPLVTVLRLPVL